MPYLELVHLEVCVLLCVAVDSTVDLDQPRALATQTQEQVVGVGRNQMEEHPLNVVQLPVGKKGQKKLLSVQEKIQLLPLRTHGHVRLTLKYLLQ